MDTFYTHTYTILIKSHNETLNQDASTLLKNYTKSNPTFKLVKMIPVNTNGLLSEMMFYNYTDPKSGFDKGLRSYFDK